MWAPRCPKCKRRMTYTGTGYYEGKTAKLWDCKHGWTELHWLTDDRGVCGEVVSGVEYFTYTDPSIDQIILHEASFDYGEYTRKKWEKEPLF